MTKDSCMEYGRCWGRWKGDDEAHPTVQKSHNFILQIAKNVSDKTRRKSASWQEDNQLKLVVKGVVQDHLSNRNQ